MAGFEEEIVPEVGDVWGPRPEVTSSSRSFLILAVDNVRSEVGRVEGNAKVLFIESKMWCWYSFYTINKSYVLQARAT